MATGLSLKEVYEKLDIPESVSKGTKLKEISAKVPSYDFDASKAKAGGTETTIKEKEASKTTTNNSNKIDISGIKGSMTIQEAAKSLKMELKDFYKLFKIPEDVPAQTQMKGISSISAGYDFEKVKEMLK